MWPDDRKEWACVLVAAAALCCMLMAGCACFDPQSPKYATPGCEVTRQAVDCTKDAAEGKAMGLLPLVTQVWNASQDWAVVEKTLTSMGFSDALCIMQVLENDFAPKAANSFSRYMRSTHPRLQLK